MEVIEQITYLLFIRRLDELQTLAERKANTTGKPIERRVFLRGYGQVGLVRVGQRDADRVAA